MPLVNTSIPNLAQGVSQQPDNLRFAGQHEAQENMLSSVVDGLRKRPFTEFVGELGDGDLDPNSFVHLINRDSSNRHLLVIEPSSTAPKIYDTADGSLINTYAASTGTGTPNIAYINEANPRENLRALTVADTTYILNKTQSISALGTNSDSQVKKAVVFVKQGDYAKDYHVDITINGTKTHCTYKSGNGSSSNDSEVNGETTSSGDAGHARGDANDASSELIAQGLWAAIIDRGISDIVLTLANFDGDILTPAVVAPDYTNATNGNAVLIEYTGNDDFTVETHDGLADQGVGVIQTEVASITDLPTNTFEDNHVKITGDLVAAQDDYYVKFNNASGVAFNGGIESIKLLTRGSSYSDATAGPHNLIFTGGGATTQATGTFTLGNYGSGNWRVETITLTSAGSGYTSTPTLDFSDAGTSAEDATAQVTLFEYNQGSWVETIAPDTPTALTATDMPYKLLPQPHLYIDSTNIVNGGSSYTNGTFALGFTGGGTPTTEAEGTFIVASNVITSINITNPGAGYSSAPTLDFSASSGGSGEDVTVTMSDGESYYIDTNTWGTRLVGDTETNPDPSFVGSTIENIFFWKNRLGFLSGQNIIFSEADEYYNFFRTTVLQLLDSAPIDVGISHTKVSNLKHVSTFQEKLIVFSDETQFVIKGNELLTPKTINVTPTTEYTALAGVEPLTQGNFIYFPFPRNSYNGVNEYAIDLNTDTFRGEEITGQVPKYIPANIKQLVGSPTEDIIVATTSNSSGTTDLYVYKYFWRGNERVQSAWSRFTFQDDIVNAFFIESDLYLVTEDGTNTHLEKMSLESGLVDTGESYAIHLDKRRAVSGLSPSYDPGTDKTTIDAGYPIGPVFDFSNGGVGTGATANVTYNSSGTITAVTVNAGGSGYTDNTGYALILTGGNPTTAATITFDVSGGAVSNFTITDGGLGYSIAEVWSQGGTKATRDASSFGNTIVVNGDHSTNAYVGIPYTSSVTLTRPTVKQSADGNGRSVSGYSHQIVRNGSIEYANTGHFKVSVATKFRSSYEHIFNANILGANTLLGQLVLQDGTFQFPVYANVNDITVTITSESALPIQLLATEFESTVASRSRRIAT
jgi:hypothetical protein